MPREIVSDRYRDLLRSRTRLDQSCQEKQTRQAQEAAYSRFMNAVGSQQATFDELFKRWRDSRRRCDILYSRLKDAEKPQGQSAAIEADEIVNISSSLEAEYEMEKNFAGVIFLLASSQLDRLRKFLGIPQKHHERFGRFIHGASLMEIIHCAGNNMRHYEEWDSKTNKMAADNLSTLRRAGVDGSDDENLCSEILELVGWNNAERMRIELFRLGDELLADRTGQKFW